MNVRLPNLPGLLVLAIALAAGPSVSIAARNDAVAPHTEAALQATLGNGLRVVIVRDTLAPIVTTQMTYRAGGYETPAGFPGTAHALEHMMFRGSNGLSGPQLDTITAQMGGYANAFTTNDATQFVLVAPASDLELLLRIEASRMRGALLNKKDWALETGAIEQEVSRDISDPDFLAFEQAEAILFAGTGYAADPLGTRPSFDRTTATALRRFYDHWYQPNNAVYVIVGDIDPRATLDKVKERFASIPAHATPKRVPVVLKPFVAQTLERTTPSATGSIQFLYRTPGLMAKDHAAVKVLFDVLNNPRSQLSELAAQGKVLGADAELDPFSRAGIGIVEVDFARGGDPKQAQAQLADTVGALLKNGIPADLVAAAKRAELADFEFSKNSAESLASAWSHALAWQGADSPAAALDAIQKVTVADVERVARDYLQPHYRVTLVMTPATSGRRPPDSSGFGGTETFAGNKKVNVPLPPWAASALAHLELPHWTLDPAVMKLANGITLVVQPEKVSKTVTVVGRVDQNAGLQEPPGEEGVGRLLASLFDYGTSTLDRTAFHATLDAIAASENGGDDFSLSVPSANFDRGLALLADNELHPALLQPAFAIQQQVLSHTLAGELESPGYKAMRALERHLLPAGDSALREATPATVDKLVLANVKDFFEHSYRPDLTTMIVVGDITPGEAQTAVEKYFGSWRAKGAKPMVIPPKVPLNPPGDSVVPNTYASQNQVQMGQMLALDLHNPDRYALQLGNDVLGGSGFASRLMQDVRVRHGYAYDVRSQMEFGRSRSAFFVSYGADPGKMGKVDNLVLHDIEAMQKESVKDHELARAQQFEIRSIPLRVGSVNRIARALLTWSYMGEPLDQPMVAAKAYRDLTASDVQAAFRKYLHPDHLAQVTEGPPPEASGKLGSGAGANRNIAW